MNNYNSENPQATGKCACNPRQMNKEVVIDFFVIDFEVCTRCQGTDKSLQEAMEEVGGLLKTVGYTVKINKVLVKNENEAQSLQLTSSPTIRINGLGIQEEMRQNPCDSCSTISGTQTDCRVWVYEGKEYNIPPKAFIIDAILQEVYGTRHANKNGENNPYTLPANLRNFFSGKQHQKKDCCMS